MNWLMDMVRSRNKGKLIPRWQAGRLPVYRGELFMEEQFRADLKRHVMTATLLDRTGKGADAPPPLWDCRVVFLKPGRWVLTGFERIDEHCVEIDYAQTWVLIAPRGVGQENVGRTGYPGSGII